MNLFYRGPMMHTPSFQLVQIAGEESRHKAWEAALFQSNTRTLFHIINRYIANGKRTIAITVAAVHGVFATVCIGTATVGIPLHMHSAGLTVFVGSFHNSRFGHFQFTKFSEKNVIMLSTFFAQSVLCVQATLNMTGFDKKSYIISFPRA